MTVSKGSPTNTDIAVGHDEWQRRVAELQQLLDVLQPELVAAEQRLSHELAEISAFEFEVRSHLSALTRRLDSLDQEINELQRRLRRLQDSWLFGDDPDADDLLRAWRSSAAAGAAAADDYRYHEAPQRPRAENVTAAQLDTLKQIYRQLARRFHPDFALNESDRVYRTDMMMAINAAYTAGDLQKLEELALQPDPQPPHYTPQELALALLREHERCLQRLAEIERDLERLAKHPSVILKRRAERAAAQDRDLFEELAAELRDRIAERLVQRDVLLAEIDGFANGEYDFADDAFADAVFNLGLEQVFTEDDEAIVSEWRDRHRDQIDLGEGDEDGWESLRKARNNGRGKAA